MRKKGLPFARGLARLGHKTSPRAVNTPPKAAYMEKIGGWGAPAPTGGGGGGGGGIP